jgi:hypothetical protein
MRLRDVVLFMGADSGFNDPFRDEFNLSVNFINSYISKRIRLLNLNMDDTVNMIHIEPVFRNVDEGLNVRGERVVRIRLYFDKDHYISLKQIDKIKYCLVLLDRGCKQLFKKDIDTLLKLKSIFLQFQSENYKNEWLYKRKIFKKEKIEVLLNCDFTSKEFLLNIVVISKQNKEVLINENLIKTLPDKNCFYPLFKDIIILEDRLIITEFQNRPKFILRLSDILKKEFKMEVTNVGLIYNKLEFN